MSTENDSKREFQDEFPPSQPDETGSTSITDKGTVKPKSKFTLMVGVVGAILFAIVILYFGWSFFMKKPVVTRSGPRPVASAPQTSASQQTLAPPAAAPAQDPFNPQASAPPASAPTPVQPAPTQPAPAQPAPAQPAPPLAAAIPAATPTGASQVQAPQAGDPLASLAQASPSASAPSPATDPFNTLAPASPAANAPELPPSSVSVPSPNPSTGLAPSGSLMNDVQSAVRMAVRAEITPLADRVTALEERMRMGLAANQTRANQTRVNQERPAPRSASRSSSDRAVASSGASSSAKPVKERRSRDAAGSSPRRGSSANRVEVIAAVGSAAERELASEPVRHQERCVAQSIIPGRAWIKGADGAFLSYGPGDTWSDGTLITDVDPASGVKGDGRVLCAATH